MKSRSFLVLLAIVAAVAAYIAFFERHQASTDERRDAANRVFPDLDEAAVDRIVVHSSDHEIVLGRSDDGWRIIEPVDFEADAASVSGLLGSLAKLDADRRLAPGDVDPAAYGLDAPDLWVELWAGGVTRHGLEIGDSTPLGSTRATSIGTGEVLLCRPTFTSHLLKEVDDWRSRNVVRVNTAGVASLEITAAGEAIEVVRLDDWQLRRPVEDRADRDHLRQMISDLNALQVAAWPDDPDLDFGFETPAAAVTIVRSDGEAPTRLEFGVRRDRGGTGEVACRRDGADVFWVNDTILTPFDKAGVRWRDPKIVRFDGWSVRSFQIRGPEHSITAERGDGMWRVGGEVADGSAVQDLLAKLSDLEARGFDLMTPATPEYGRVELRVDDSGAEGDGRVLNLAVHRPMTAGGRAMVVADDRDTIMSVDMTDLEAIFVAPDDLLPKAAETMAGTGDPSP